MSYYINGITEKKFDFASVACGLLKFGRFGKEINIIILLTMLTVCCSIPFDVIVDGVKVIPEELDAPTEGPSLVTSVFNGIVSPFCVNWEVAYGFNPV